MTALPDSDATTSFALNFGDCRTRRTASVTAPASMIAPSTMLSGGSGSTPIAATLKPRPDGLQLDRLDRAGTDVQADHGLASVEEHYAAFPSSRRTGTSDRRRVAKGKPGTSSPEFWLPAGNRPKLRLRSPVGRTTVVAADVTDRIESHAQFFPRTVDLAPELHPRVLYRHESADSRSTSPKRPIDLPRQCRAALRRHGRDRRSQICVSAGTV